MVIENVDLQQIVNKGNVALIDVSWVLHKSAYVFAGMSYNGIPTGNLYGLLNAVHSFLSCNVKSVILVKDGKPVERKAICEAAGVDYKGQRDGHAETVYGNLSDGLAMASYHPDVYFSYNEDKEADDNIYCLAKKLHDLGCIEVIIHSGDNDLLQTLTKDEKIIVARKWDRGCFVDITYSDVATKEEFTKKFHGVEPSVLPLFRAMCGDSSDNIAGIYRLPRKKAASWTMQAGWDIHNRSVDDDLECLHSIIFQESLKKDKWAMQCLNQWDVIKNNYAIMKLNADYEANLVKVKPTRAEFDALIKKYNMRKWYMFV